MHAKLKPGKRSKTAAWKKSIMEAKVHNEL